MLFQFLHSIIVLFVTIFLYFKHHLRRYYKLSQHLLTKSSNSISLSKTKCFQHIGLVFPRFHDIYFEELKTIFEWCVELNFRFITLHQLKDDRLSESKQLISILQKLQSTTIPSITKIIVRTKSSEIEISNNRITSKHVPSQSFSRFDFNETESHLSDNSKEKKLLILITSETFAKELLVDCAKSLSKAVKTEENPQRTADVCLVDYNLYNNCHFLRGIPEIDVALEFSTVHNISGLLPWHIRLTEFYCVGQIKDFTKDEFLETMINFSEKEQRVGK